MAKKQSGGSKGNTFKIGRDAKNGQFIPVHEAERRPGTTVVERISKGKSSDRTTDTGPRKK